MKKNTSAEILLLLLIALPLPIFWLILLPLQYYPATFGKIVPWLGRDEVQEFLVTGFGGYLTTSGFFFGLTALIALGINRIRHREASDRRSIFSLLFAVAAVLWLVFTFCPARGSLERIRRIGCAGNLRQLHLALCQYGIDNSDYLPPDLETLKRIVPEYAPEIYQCPSTGPDTTRFSDYLYSGAGRKLSEKPPFVLLEDRPDNHPGMFRNQLTSDGVIRNIGK